MPADLDVKFALVGETPAHGAPGGFAGLSSLRAGRRRGVSSSSSSSSSVEGEGKTGDNCASSSSAAAAVAAAAVAAAAAAAAAAATAVGYPAYGNNHNGDGSGSRVETQHTDAGIVANVGRIAGDKLPQIAARCTHLDAGTFGLPSRVRPYGYGAERASSGGVNGSGVIGGNSGTVDVGDCSCTRVHSITDHGQNEKSSHTSITAAATSINGNSNCNSAAGIISGSNSSSSSSRNNICDDSVEAVVSSCSSSYPLAYADSFNGLLSTLCGDVSSVGGSSSSTTLVPVVSRPSMRRRRPSHPMTIGCDISAAIPQTATTAVAAVVPPTNHVLPSPQCEDKRLVSPPETQTTAATATTIAATGADTAASATFEDSTRSRTSALVVSPCKRCPICQRNFANRRNLENHIRSAHTREKPYKCLFCSKLFCAPNTRGMHMRRHHPQHYARVGQRTW